MNRLKLFCLDLACGKSPAFICNRSENSKDTQSLAESSASFPLLRFSLHRSGNKLTGVSQNLISCFLFSRIPHSFLLCLLQLSEHRPAAKHNANVTGLKNQGRGHTHTHCMDAHHVLANALACRMLTDPHKHSHKHTSSDGNPSLSYSLSLSQTFFFKALK